MSEELIEKTKRAMYLARHADQQQWAQASWNAGQVYADTDAELDAEARAALAVFEESLTPTGEERARKAVVRRAVGGVLFNASNFPEKAQTRLLGQNMGPLNEKITEAVMSALAEPVVSEPSTEHGCDLGEDCDGRCNEVAGETPGFISCPCGWSRIGLFHQLHDHQRTHEAEPQAEPTDAPKVVTLDDVYEVTALEALVAEARSRGEWCCDNGCGSGACETCPCCSAGWCVSGVDGVPDAPEDRERWLEVAAEYNPVAAALRAAASTPTQTGESK